MTFKHVQFQDSPVMRSLEKVAREKGLVKEPTLEKTAFSKGFSSTGNLLADLLKLSEGLRSAGLVKQADDLEIKALAYKKAQTLYETSKEKGEDLIDAAHPKGGHKLEDIKNNEAVFETIVEQHLKNVDMVGRNPTGKLSSANSILTAVRVVLAQDSFTKNQELKTALKDLSHIVQTLFSKIEEANSLTFSVSSFKDALNASIAKPTLSNLALFDSNLSKLWKRVSPGILGGLSEETWVPVKRLITEAGLKQREIVTLTKEYLEFKDREEQGHGSSTVTVPAAPVVNFTAQKIQQAKMNLNGIIGLINADTTADPEDTKAALGWAYRIAKALKDLEARSAQMNAEDVDASLAKLTKDFAEVKKQWV